MNYTKLVFTLLYWKQDLVYTCYVGEVIVFEDYSSANFALFTVSAMESVRCGP